MRQDELIAEIRAIARDLPFESAAGREVALHRLSDGLPASESPRGELDPEIEAETRSEYAELAIEKTILHSHDVRVILDPRGNGSIVIFHRHVIEGEQRWDFEVRVKVDRKGIILIGEVSLVPPGDEPEGHKRPVQLSPDELLPFGMLACPCCGHATLDERGGYDICRVCFWEDDGADNAEADRHSGPNHMTLTEGRINFLRTGASDARSLHHVRRPTAEEVQLRQFGADGRELTSRPDATPPHGDPSPTGFN